MSIFKDFRRKVEHWLLSDTLGSHNFTNINEISNDFLEKFGINQLCLIEMFDKQTKNFYSPKTAGFGFVVKTQNITVEQMETLAALSEDIQEGFGLLISSFYHGYAEIDEVLISVSTGATFTEVEKISVLEEIKSKVKSKLDSGFIDVKPMDAEFIINYLAEVFYPNELFLKKSSLVYEDSFFIKDQIKSSNEDLAAIDSIEVKKDYIEFVSGDVVYRNIGFGVQRYFNHDIEFVKENYEDFLTNKPVFFDGVIHCTLGFFNPLVGKPKGKKEKITNEIRFKQKPQVFHLMNCYIKGTKQDIEKRTTDAIDSFYSSMNFMGYQVAPLANRQLANLFFTIPTNLNAEIFDDIYSLRLSTVVKKILVHDVLPVTYTLTND